MVEPTTPEETLQILNNIKDKYETHHNVSFTDDALKACVSLTERYVSDRNFPDKAIDALDEAGSRAHITNIMVPQEIEQLRRTSSRPELPSSPPPSHRTLRKPPRSGIRNKS